MRYLMKILNLCHFLTLSLEGSYSIEGKYSKNVSNYQIVYPIKIPSGLNNRLNPRHIRSEDKSESTIHYKLKVGGKDEFIDLLPNPQILTPDAVMEYRKNITSDNDPLVNIELEKISLHHCYFKGKVRNYEDSLTALSVCDGLHGFIRVKRNIYFIEPINNNANCTVKDYHPHVIYEDVNNGKHILNCATNDSYDSQQNHIYKSHHKMRSKSQKLSMDGDLNVSIKPLHLETLLVIDKSMLDLHNRKDVLNYILTAFNIAHSLFHDLKTDPPINLEIVRIIEVENEKDNSNFGNSYQLGSSQLQRFSDWQHMINPKEDTHSNHHDLAILITGSSICNEQGDCHYIGIAESGGACKPKREAAICKDSGLMLGYIIAHEIAHTLGVNHDSESSSCKPVLSDGLSTIMSPVITSYAREWSQCSSEYLTTALKKRQLSCLEDEPIAKVETSDILPGVLYDADYQCQQLFTSNAKCCNQKGECGSLFCEYEGASCTNTGVMPALGTSCGENKWCYEEECLEAGRRPRAVHGNWGNWSDWSPCSRTCGAGVSVSSRKCDSPSPMHGGKSCIGKRKRHMICSTQPCEIGSHPFRDIQCAEFNDWIFPEDGEIHKWKGFFISNGNPCALYCRNDMNIVVSLSPKVKDGTTCYRGIRDICVDGVCQDIPCDLLFDSNSVEDGCGVCHGNGTGCKVLHGQKEVKKGMTKIITIPMGTRNIIMEESIPTQSHFILKKPDTNEIINKGNKLGLFNISGSAAWLGMVKPNQKILEIPGSLNKPIEVWLSTTGEQTLTYSMGLPSDTRFPREGKYNWDYIDWSPCKAQCGESVQETIPRCVEKLSGRVEDKYCEKIEKPPVKTRSCNAGVCFPRWLIGEWQECGPCPNKEAKRFRLVRCIAPIAGSEEGTVIVDDKRCPGNRPAASEYCRCIKRHVFYWPYLNYKELHHQFTNHRGKNSKKGNMSMKPPEKKVTLMQLENENEESMLEQLKENQNKHHSFYMPHLLSPKFNFTIPFRKRESLMHLKNDDLLKQLNKYFINGVYFYKNYIASDSMATTNNLHTPNPHGCYNLLGHSNVFDSDLKQKKLPSLEPKDLPFHHLLEKNVLLNNLYLEQLNKKQELKQSNENSNLIKIRNIDTTYGSNSTYYNIYGRNCMLDLLMNEFYKILAANVFTKANLTSLQKGSNYIRQEEGSLKKRTGQYFLNSLNILDKYFNCKPTVDRNNEHAIKNITFVPNSVGLQERNKLNQETLTTDYYLTNFPNSSIKHCKDKENSVDKYNSAASHKLFYLFPHEIEPRITNNETNIAKGMNQGKDLILYSVHHITDSNQFNDQVLSKEERFKAPHLTKILNYLNQVLNEPKAPQGQGEKPLCKSSRYLRKNDVIKKVLNLLQNSNNNLSDKTFENIYYFDIRKKPEQSDGLGTKYEEDRFMRYKRYVTPKSKTNITSISKQRKYTPIHISSSEQLLINCENASSLLKNSFNNDSQEGNVSL